MLELATRMLRFRKGTFIATFLALAAGVMILMTCGLLVESGLRYQGTPQRYAGAVAIVADRELTVAGPEVFGETESATVALPEGGRVPASLVTTLAAVPGVAGAVGDHSIPVTVAVAGPVTGHGWASTVLTPYRLTAGTRPQADDEIAIDDGLAAGGKLQPGDPTTMIVGGTERTFRVSGVVDGPPAVFFTDAQAARLDPNPGTFSAIGVVADPGATKATVVAGIRKAAGDREVYVDDERGLVEQPEAGAARSLTVQAGSAFGGYAAMIIIFVVAGTVGLSVRHRRRDLALLRAIAATPGQVRGLILAEVGLLSVLAAVVGVPAGLAATAWTRDQLVARGFVPDSFVLSGGVLSALAVTVAVAAVALGSAWIAALRTTRIRPTEALGEAAVERALGGRVRIVSGLVFLAGGVSLIGLTGATNGTTALGAATGMLYTFVLAVALLAPWINQASARLLTPVLRKVWGNSGYLAAANLRANARGMVAVLTALVLSVGFGGTVWFLQDNLQRQTVTQSQDGMLAQHALVSGAGLPQSAVAEARKIPGVVAATGVHRTAVITSGGLEAAAVPAQGIDPLGADQTMDLGVREGSLADLQESTVAVSGTQAAAAGWKLGSDARLWLGDGTPVTLRVVAIYDRGWGFGDVTLASATLAGHTATGLDDHILIRTAPGVDAGPGLARAFPAGTVISADGLTGELAQDLAVSSWLNKMLIAVLVGYALLAAANTLIMAALARRRELSLLRLVGVTRGQVKRMVHAEQAGLLGVALVIGTVIAAVTLSAVVNAISGERIPYVPALGAAAIIGGTIALALVATMLPIGRVLRTPPVEGIGIRE